MAEEWEKKHPDLYVMSGFSSTVMSDTEGSIFGGSGIWIWYFWRSTLHGTGEQLECDEERGDGTVHLNLFGRQQEDKAQQC